MGSAAQREGLPASSDPRGRPSLLGASHGDQPGSSHLGASPASPRHTHAQSGPGAEGLRRRGIRLPHKALVQTRAEISKHVRRIAKKADEHQHLLNKVTYFVGVVCFGTFCFLLGSRPYDIPRLYAAFFLVAAPLRWVYYKSKKWHYFLLDFCYYANVILVAYLVFFPTHEKLFLLCFAFSEGPLAWALIVWRCSLVFSSVDKIVSVLIHLLPGTVIYIIRWWDPVTFRIHSADDTGPFPAWPLVPSTRFLLLWLFAFPLLIYSLWQMLYLLIVEVLRRQRLVRDPEVMTSFRELSRKASRANNVWWQLSGLLGDNNRLVMYALLQGIFTVATVGLTIPMFRSYRLHSFFQIFKVAAAIWNGGNFFFDVMPRQVQAKAEKRARRVAPAELQEGEGKGQGVGEAGGRRGEGGGGKRDRDGMFGGGDGERREGSGAELGWGQCSEREAKEDVFGDWEEDRWDGRGQEEHREEEMEEEVWEEVWEEAEAASNE